MRHASIAMTRAIVLAVSAVIVFAGSTYAIGLQSWDKAITSGAERFKVVLGGAAVLDNETGLVWEQSPDANPRTWANALSYCVDKTVGSRRGWRLPTIQELSSLMDPTVTNPSFPPGHPFATTLIQPYPNGAEIWSANTKQGDDTRAWEVNFYYNFVGDNPKVANIGFYAWCVRGGSGIDTQ